MTLADPTTLVLVEDHVALRQGVELLLGRRGHVIAGSTADADEGFELIRSVAPDVAIIDVGLGTQSGALLTRRLLEDDPGLRILLYTGTNDPEMIGEALDCGARGFALKAGPPSELVEAIRVLKAGGTYMDPRLSSHLLTRSTTERVHELSPRQREIFDLLAGGHTGAQVAKELVLSPETVRTHVRNAMAKLEARTRVHAVALALRQQEISFAEGVDGVPDGQDAPDGRRSPGAARRRS
jgi:DNA-binding NarL/FixJ family response regulator